MKFMNNHYGQPQIFGRARCKMPMNLQFFAESPGDGGDSGGGGSDSGDGEEPTLSVEDLLAQLNQANEIINQLKDTNAQTKSALDKQMKKNGELTKQNRAGMSETQLEIQSLKDQNEEIVNQNKELMEQNKKLVENDRISRYTKSLMSCAMDEKTADLFAQSIGELKDEPKFFATFKKYAENLTKSAGENAVQELIKSNPDIKAGTGSTDKNAWVGDVAKELAHQKTGVNTSNLERYM